jgi:hypothetical protein
MYRVLSIVPHDERMTVKAKLETKVIEEIGSWVLSGMMDKILLD